ncbi:MAG: hypothetical protein WCV91_06240 [Candidatus Margulisiibacteriota bacterium]
MKLLLILLIMMFFAAMWAVMTSLILRAAIALALTSMILTTIMFQLNAPYAAVFELSVCAGLIPVIFISVISLAHRLPIKEYLKRRENRINRFWILPFIAIAIVVLIGIVRLPLGLNVAAVEKITDVREVLWNLKRLEIFGQIIVLLAGAYGVLILFKERNRDS